MTLQGPKDDERDGQQTRQDDDLRPTESEHLSPSVNENARRRWGAQNVSVKAVSRKNLDNGLR